MRQTSRLFTGAAEELNSGLRETTPASGQSVHLFQFIGLIPVNIGLLLNAKYKNTNLYTRLHNRMIVCVPYFALDLESSALLFFFLCLVSRGCLECSPLIKIQWSFFICLQSSIHFRFVS